MVPLLSRFVLQGYYLLDKDYDTNSRIRLIENWPLDFKISYTPEGICGDWNHEGNQIMRTLEVLFTQCLVYNISA